MRSESKQTAVHLHGLFYPLQMRLLRKMLPANCALVAQHHAEKPWQGLHSSLQRWGLCTADGFFFAARELADCWIDRGLISRRQGIFEVMEGSNHFRYQERRVSRARTGLTGTPMVLWVGNLTPNKDPLTVLDGFEKILMQVPAARLYMAYRSTELLAVVRDRIRSSSILYNAVTLMGSVDHDKLEDVYNSADFFVTGSHYEGSGFALAEAMACGVVPLVTAIPSFIAMTDKGRAGACWAAGDSDAFSRAFLEVLRKPVEDLSKRTLRFFDQQLSYPAIARASLRGYTELISARTETGE
jgi:glycosyltransferase involved in cell wall biosynthesis